MRPRPIGLGNYFVCNRFAFQTLLWSLEFLIQSNLKNDTITIINVVYSLYFVEFSAQDILQIMKNLDCDKAYDHNEPSIRMLKICGSPACRPFKIYLKFSFKISKASTRVEKS